MDNKKVSELVKKISTNLNFAKELNEEDIRLLMNEYHEIISKQPICKKISAGSMLVSGDIHGDFEIMKKVIEIFQANKNIDHLIFLGDLVDRGTNSIACLNLLFALTIKNPGKIHFVRGNHEATSVNSRYGFVDEIQKFGSTRELFEEYNKVFADMSLTLVHQGLGYFFVHGGLPINSPSIDELSKLPKGDQMLENPIIRQLLWNDPKEELVDSYGYSMRGMGIYTYGKKLVDEFLENNNLRKIIRAHEAFSDGHKYFFDKKLLSLFTSEEYYQFIQAKIAFINKQGIIRIFSPKEKIKLE